MIEILSDQKQHVFEIWDRGLSLRQTFFLYFKLHRIGPDMTMMVHQWWSINDGLSVMAKPSNIAILLKMIKDNQDIDNISIIKNNKGYFK